MACRIQNLGKHRLAVDLRGGGVMYVQPNEISPPVREELLYDNIHLAGWEARGLARRINAKMADVLTYEAKVTGRPAPAEEKPKAAEKRSKPADAKASDDDDGNEAGDDEEEKVEKKPRKSVK
jgi:hypothetical protein